MPTVYVETTVPSYVVARPSRDLIVAAHQKITHEWWAIAPERFHLCVSQAVLDELREGDPDYAARRLEQIRSFDVLAFSNDVEFLIREYDRRLGLGGSATADLPHFAYAVAYNVDYLVTWNCKHIANGQVIRRLAVINGSPDAGDRDSRRTADKSSRRGRVMDDPIVDEVHTARQRILAECDGNLDRMIERLRRSELQEKDRLVDLSEFNARAGRLKSVSSAVPEN